MPRIHIEPGVPTTLVETGDKPIWLKTIMIFTDHVNDASAQVIDRDGPVFAQPLPVAGEAGHGGVSQINEKLNGPASAYLSGTGAKATIYYSNVK